MLPQKDDPQWARLVTGEISHKFTSVPAGMCVSRNIREYQHDPTPERLQAGVDEIYSFFRKYEAIVTEDITALFTTGA